MQLKKYEAPTLQEALDSIKRDLGPEAVILQTKRNRKGFGLMSKSSVEVTVAISEKATTRRTTAESQLSEKSRDAMRQLPAQKQSELIDTMVQKAEAARDRVELSAGARKALPRPRTTARYVDIREDGSVAPTVITPPSAPVRARPAASSPTASPQVPALEEEVRQLKRLITDLKSAQDEGGALRSAADGGALRTPALQECFDQLVIQGVDKRLALKLLKEATFELGDNRLGDADVVTEQIASEIMTSTPVSSVLGGLQPGGRSKVITVVGPTGVGKTTTVAKLASDAIIRKNLKVGLINLDCYKVAAFDQLATYAKILNVPFRSAANAQDLAAALQELKPMDLILIDTTGRSQRDPQSLQEMKALISGISDVSTQLVLSVTTRDNELYDMAQRFSVFKPEGLILSKLDEATTHGVIYNAAQKTRLPLTFFTTGQRVPEDIEEATPERVASLVLEI